MGMLNENMRFGQPWVSGSWHSKGSLRGVVLVFFHFSEQIATTLEFTL